MSITGSQYTGSCIELSEHTRGKESNKMFMSENSVDDLTMWSTLNNNWCTVAVRLWSATIWSLQAGCKTLLSLCFLWVNKTKTLIDNMKPCRNSVSSKSGALKMILVTFAYLYCRCIKRTKHWMQIWLLFNPIRIARLADMPEEFSCFSDYFLIMRPLWTCAVVFLPLTPPTSSHVSDDVREF